MNKRINKQLEELRATAKDTAAAGLIEAWIGYMTRCSQLMFATSWIDDVTQLTKDAVVLTQIQRLADDEQRLLERSELSLEQSSRLATLQTELEQSGISCANVGALRVWSLSVAG